MSEKFRWRKKASTSDDCDAEGIETARSTVREAFLTSPWRMHDGNLRESASKARKHRPAMIVVSRVEARRRVSSKEIHVSSSAMCRMGLQYNMRSSDDCGCRMVREVYLLAIIVTSRRRLMCWYEP